LCPLRDNRRLPASVSGHLYSWQLAPPCLHLVRCAFLSLFSW